jgi:hypothetical protein
MQASAQAALDDATAELARVQRLAVLGVLDEQEAVEHSVRARQAATAAQRHLDTLPRVTASTVDLRRRLDDWYRVDEAGNPILDVQERRALLGMAIRRVTVARIGRIGRARYQALPMSSRAPHRMDRSRNSPGIVGGRTGDVRRLRPPGRRLIRRCRRLGLWISHSCVVQATVACPLLCRGK